MKSTRQKVQIMCIYVLVLIQPLSFQANHYNRAFTHSENTYQTSDEVLFLSLPTNNDQDIDISLFSVCFWTQLVDQTSTSNQIFLTLGVNSTQMLRFFYNTAETVTSFTYSSDEQEIDVLVPSSDLYGNWFQHCLTLNLQDENSRSLQLTGLANSIPIKTTLSQIDEVYFHICSTKQDPLTFCET